VEVGPDTYVKDALPGSEIFMRIPTGDGFVDGSAAAGNTGNGVLTNITRDGSDSWNGQSFSIRFTAADQYEVLDGANNVTGTGVQGRDDLEVNGCACDHRRTAAGDSFSVQAASSRDIFDTMDNLMAALGADTGTTAQMTAQQNQLQSALRGVARVRADDRFACRRCAAEGAGQCRRHA
jgi:flagellar hook-associated protein 3 FlgL